MKILFDLRVLTEGWSGIAVYTVNLLKTISNSEFARDIVLLVKDEEIKKKLKLKFFIDTDLFYKTIFLKNNIYSPLGFLKLKKILKKENIDGYFTPQFFWPYGLITIKVICMIHDIIPLTHSTLMSKSKKSKFSFILKYFTYLSLKMSYKIIVNSETTLNSLSLMFGKVLTNKCVKIYPIILHKNLMFKEGNLSDKGNIIPYKNYILYVGRHDPYKNLVRLIQAFKLLKQENVFKGKLILAGKSDSRYKAAFDVVKEQNIENEVVFLDFVDDENLELLYRNCNFAVQPSIAEGFGLTAVEPFLYGKLCVMSKIPSFIECFGDNMIYFNPLDVLDIKNTLTQVIAMEEHKMNEMIEYGQASIKKFNSETPLTIFEKIWLK